MPRRLAVALVAAAAVAAAAPAAHAGRPGVWTRVSDPPVSSNIDRPSLARTPDGILHVVWKRDNAVDTGRDDLMHSAVRPGGALIGSQPVAANWSIIGRASILVDPAVGLRVLVGGQAGTPPGNTANQALSTATSADGGATWVLSPSDVAGGAVLGNEGPTAAIVDSTGTVVSVFGSVRVHRGLIAPADSTTIPTFQPVCCGGYGNLAAATGGQIWVAWHASENPPGERGVFYQGADPGTGAPLGTRTRLTWATASAPSQPVALAALRGPSARVLVGATTPDGFVEVADLTTGARTSLRSGRGADDVWLAADDAGRAWAAWATRRGAIAVRRSNVGATRWGALVEVALPSGAGTMWGLMANAQTGVLDLVPQLSVSRGAGNPDTGLGAWHTQVRPGLTLSVVRAAVRAGQDAIFDVRDAGDPVAGARVRVGARAAVTNARGRAVLRIAATALPGPRTATATKAGYAAATGTLIVRPPR
jgi:hypothetical protein